MKTKSNNQKKYKHFSHEERIVLQTLLDQGKLRCEIAKLMHRSASTISREIKT
ncbi:MAG: helix-turn-helix domain-containing protein [Leptospiraceae bacterium]|nr:helix-turn-helix domain-containing protein [Leptospiraceae bacterium]